MPIVRFVFFIKTLHVIQSLNTCLSNRLCPRLLTLGNTFFVGLVFYENCARGLERYHVFSYLVSYILSHIKLAHVSLKVHTCLISGVLYVLFYSAFSRLFFCWTSFKTSVAHVILFLSTRLHLVSKLEV